MAPLGNLVRLVPLELDILPSHPALETIIESRRPQPIERSSNREENVSSKEPQKATQSASDFEPSIIDVNGRPHLRPFVTEVLDQAVTFMDDTLPATFKSGSEKSSSPSSAKVRLSKREITGKHLSEIAWQDSKIPRNVPQRVYKSTEVWFARRSRHINGKGAGTADFLEFDRSLRVKHSEHEGEYTPDVFDVHNVIDWAIHDEPVRKEDNSVEEQIRDSCYNNITMGVFEICHKLPFPLSPRVFSVLVITAKIGEGDFIVVQIPIHIARLEEALYSNGRNEQEGDTPLKRKRILPGFVYHQVCKSNYCQLSLLKPSVYTSIERCVVLPNQEIEWVMATASDAKGWLPMWAQKMGVPGAIVKDVGLVMKWISEQRAKNEGP